MTLDNAIRLEGALDFIKRGYTKEQHVECFKPAYREIEAIAFDDALKMVGTVGSVRKAINQVEKIIDSYREKVSR